MINKINYYKKLYDRFGIRAVRFLIESRFVKNKLINRKIKGAQYPVHLSNYTTDVTTLFQIFYAKEYQLADRVEPRFILDCGANIGMSAIWYANTYPAAKIIAIEPDANNFAFLRKNTENYPNVICLNNAVWSHETLIEIVDRGTGNWSLQTIESKSITTNSIKAISISKIMEQFQVDVLDILKIDIEGAEKELFSNNYQDWLPKTSIIAIELHDNIDAAIPGIFYNAISTRKYTKYHNGENLICDFR